MPGQQRFDRVAIMDDVCPVLFASFLSAAAILDLRTGKIPNVLTYLAMVTALAVYGATQGLSGLGFSAAGLGLGLAMLIVPYAMGGMGAGDVKLMAAVGAALGPRGVFNAFLFAALAGGLYAAAVLSVHSGGPRQFFARALGMFKTLLLTKSLGASLPPKTAGAPKLYYGVAISLGTACSILWHAWFGSYLV
jgi:prepilin peptidase CpaA